MYARLLSQVFKAATQDDFNDVANLLPDCSPLPMGKGIVYLIARLEVRSALSSSERLALVNKGGASMADAFGPAVGCLVSTYDTGMLSRVYQCECPEEIKQLATQERLETWSVRVTFASNDLLHTYKLRLQYGALHGVLHSTWAEHGQRHAKPNEWHDS